MKKLSYLLYFIALSIIPLSSCQNVKQAEEFAENTDQVMAQAPLTLDNAINEVNNLLDVLNITRSGGKRTISTCFTITKDYHNTPSSIRKNDSGTTDDPLVYIINFENDEGYALVAAGSAATSTILGTTAR